MLGSFKRTAAGCTGVASQTLPVRSRILQPDRAAQEPVHIVQMIICISHVIISTSVVRSSPWQRAMMTSLRVMMLLMVPLGTTCMPHRTQGGLRCYPWCVHCTVMTGMIVMLRCIVVVIAACGMPWWEMPSRGLSYAAVHGVMMPSRAPPEVR